MRFFTVRNKLLYANYVLVFTYSLEKYNDLWRSKHSDSIIISFYYKKALCVVNCMALALLRNLEKFLRTQQVLIAL